MIEIISVRELRYASPEQVPIEKKKAIRNIAYIPTIQQLYEETRKKVAEKAKEVYGEKYFRAMWREVSALYDKEFLTKLISLWKEKVFEKSIKISEEISLEKENEMFEECLKSDEMQKELERYFLSEYWKKTSLGSMR